MYLADQISVFSSLLVFRVQLTALGPEADRQLRINKSRKLPFNDAQVVRRAGYCDFSAPTLCIGRMILTALLPGRFSRTVHSWSGVSQSNRKRLG